MEGNPLVLRIYFSHISKASKSMPASYLNEFISELTIKKLPGEVVEAARHAILDAIGVGLAGCCQPVHAIAKRFISQFPMEPLEASLWGSSAKTSAIWAALVNGLSASCLDADDGHRAALGHPGAVIIPAAMALAERSGASGRQLLEAVVVGYEIGIRVGAYLNRDQKNIYHGSGTWAAIGAAAAGARMLTLKPDQCLSALGIAEINTPLALIMNWISLRHVPQVKEGMGWGAMTGVAAALLAQIGLRGVFSLCEQPDGQIITRGLGKEFEITKIYFKQHSACRWTHSAIDGIIQAVKDYGLNENMIHKIIISTHRKAACLDNARPAEAEQAQYSIPYTVAAAIIHGQVGPNQMQQAAIKDPSLRALAAKVALQCDDELERRFPEVSLARITVEAVDGRTIDIEPQPYTKGDPHDPFTAAALEDKFRTYAGFAIPKDRTDKIISTIKNMEDLSRVDELTRLLCP